MVLGGVVAGRNADDFARICNLRAHRRMPNRAVDEGRRVRGYDAWSLLDTFEWSRGCSKRFGLVHVNFATQKPPRRIAPAGWGGSLPTTASDGM